MSDTAPTPFTADEIREGCPVGRAITVAVEPAEGPVFHRHIRFVRADDGGAAQVIWNATPGGERLGDASESFSTWEELREHAAFPLAATTIAEEVIDAPMGRILCLRYEVEDEGGAAIFWFCADYPGMPVRYATVRDGIETDVVTMIDSHVES